MSNDINELTFSILRRLAITALACLGIVAGIAIVEFSVTSCAVRDSITLILLAAGAFIVLYSMIEIFLWFFPSRGG